MKTYGNMETGYINEDEIEPVVDLEGGQLKSKNGQKYVLNHYQRPESFCCSKVCVCTSIAIFIMSFFLGCLLTYLLLTPSCQSLSSQNDNNINTAGIWGSHSKENGIHSSSNGMMSDQAEDITKLPQVIDSRVPKAVEEEIEFHEGWKAKHYDLLLEPHIENSTSSGRVDVWMTRDHSIDKLMPIVFDVTEIDIISCKIEKVDREDVYENLIFSHEYGTQNQSYVLTLKEPQYRLTDVLVRLEFTSKLTSTLQGFYRGSFHNEDTKADSWFVSTQFSPIDCRRAFPSVDRPYAKATFKISIIRPIDKLTSLSNMPVEFTEIVRDGYIRENFKITPKMSTYLVAFHISDLKVAKESNETDDSLPHIKMYAQPGYENMTNFAYSLTVKSLPFFENYFGIPFNLPKIDMVAVPDFGFNAMENWGLITFRESAMLAPQSTNQSSSVQHLQRLSGTLVHEIAHQWFGNLVTMKWYDDLWLKEGFATYLSYVGIDAIKPEWDYFKTITMQEVQKAMPKDCDAASRPISFNVRTQSDIRRVFDPISYSKGALIINMMRGFLGESAFRSGLTSYLKKFAYGNAVQDDLWEAMQSFALKDQVFDGSFTMKDIMDSWTVESAGFPVVTVKRNESDVIISQQRYFLPHTNVSDTTRWFVPISYATSTRQPNNEVPEYWLTKDGSSEIVIENAVAEDEFIYLNINRTGYYRVNYDQLSWKNLLNNMKNLSDVTRAMLIDDAFNLARANLTDYDIPITMGFVIRNVAHDDYLSWWAFDSGLAYISNMIKREPAYESFRTVIKNIVHLPFETFNFEDLQDESELETLHRQRIVNMACEFGIDRCTQTAQLIFREWIASKIENKIPANLKSTIYCVTLREGGVQEWNFAFKQFEETTSASEKEIILTALGCTQKPWLLSKYLNLTITENSPIKKQDGARVFQSVAMNIIGTDLAFDFLYTHLAEIAEYYGDGFNTIAKMVESVTTFMNKVYHKEQFERFAEKANKLGLVAIEKSINLAEIEIDKNIFWRDHLYDKLKDILDKAIKDLRLTP